MSYESAAFHLLDERIKRFLWAEGWATLRDAQEEAIPIIVEAKHDVIVAAATASGKTEAAFLPALTHLLQSESPGLIVYVSPLKALINDQFGRLDRLCKDLDIAVWRWHGDVSSSVKARFTANPTGVLLITPESLEALFCLRGTSVGRIFSQLKFVVIDELHAFIGSERGKQLQSLLHRIDVVVGRFTPRIGLSATLGDMSLAADFLRSGGQARVIESRSGGTELKIALVGIEEPPAVKDAPDDETAEPIAAVHVARHLFDRLRGSNNLVFPNSRREVERYAYLLRQLSEAQQVPNEFWPHHGNLSKEIRADTEAALKQRERPATAICTSTLELGIDIGAVKSVAQIGPAPAVASLRQRLGRSGRRAGEPAILRGYCIEDAPAKGSSIATELRLDTVRMVAQISLLVEGWFEPPRPNGLHASTLVQQILSYVAQLGGATIGQLYGLLCGAGTPFTGITKAEFAELVRHLGENELLVQDATLTLLHGRVGEKFVNHYSFFAAFASDEEYRVLSAGRALGTLPVTQLLVAGQRILFAGRTWRVDQVDEQQKAIHVSKAGGGAPPMFAGGVGRTHTRVRQRMRELLESRDSPAYLDDTGRRFIDEGRAAYAKRSLATEFTIDQGHELVLLTWLGDSANEALACMLRLRGFVAIPAGPGIEVSKGQRGIDEILDTLTDVSDDSVLCAEDLLTDPKSLQREKWDWALPDPMLKKSFASLNLDLEEARMWVRLALFP